MLVQATRLAKDSTRRLLVSLGLFPYARRAREWLCSIPYRHRTKFIIRLDGRDVCLVTTDTHSKVWCYRRNESRQGDLHEPAIVKELARRVGNAKAFADVGGHLGYYSCIAGVLNPHLKVFCFEMNQRLIPAIRANFQANQMRNAIVVSSPVADKRKLVSYSRASVSSDEPIHTEGDCKQKSRSRIYTETITLDDFFSAQETVPDIIKIDVEGAEMEVLQGAATLIKNHRPVLFLELHPKEIAAFNSSIIEIVDYLEYYRYSLYMPAYFRWDGKIKAVDRKRLLSLDRSDMVICVPEGQPPPASSFAA